MTDFNVIIRNGKIIDGSGNPWFHSDVGVKNEEISFIGSLSSESTELVIDAKGCLVCPGFIDIHSHSDESFLVNPKADSKITQGVTTEIVGNCGNSMVPITEYGKEFYKKEYEEKGIDWDFNSVSEYFNRLIKKGMALNVGALIGHGNVRASVMGYENRAPTTEELETMKNLVEGGMKDGAIGLSTGLKYAPGCYAVTQEIIELMKIVSKYNGIYSSHIRNQGDYLIESIDEAIEIGEKANTPIVISHLKSKGRKNWGKAANVLRIIDQSRSSGIQIAFDQYPYPAGSSNLISRLPSWAREGGPKKALERIKDPELRDKIEKGILESEDWLGAEGTIIANFSPNPSLEGKNIAEIAKMRNKKPEAVVCDLLIEADGLVPVVSFYGWEKDVRDIMTHHCMMVGSDGSSLANYGILGKGKPHPRNYGTFSKFLRRYVIDEEIMSVEDGIRRMTSMPALSCGLRDRGLLRENMKADIVIFDPKILIDTATYENPHQYSKGVKFVLVNGISVIEDEIYNGKTNGQIIKNNKWIH